MNQEQDNALRREYLRKAKARSRQDTVGMGVDVETDLYKQFSARCKSLHLPKKELVIAMMIAFANRQSIDIAVARLSASRKLRPTGARK